MSLPNVLLIGAMKAGTTGLYMDLATHPDVFLAQDKEPQCLCNDDVLTDSGKQHYAKIYEGARKGQTVCDASTSYAKRPEFDGVVERALKVLPEGFKVIYLVRHPIDRIMSQHHHEHCEGMVGENMENEVKRHSRYLDYSRYAYQLQPWLDAIGRDRIKVVRFEDYRSHRCEVVEETCDFLRLSLGQCQIKTKKIYNKSSGKPVLNSFWKSVSSNAIYKVLLRMLLPPKLRIEISRSILPSAPEKPSSLPAQRFDWLKESLIEDVLKLSEMLGHKKPTWEDFTRVNISLAAEVSDRLDKTEAQKNRQTKFTADQS